MICFFSSTLRDEIDLGLGHGDRTVGNKIIAVVTFNLVDADNLYALTIRIVEEHRVCSKKGEITGCIDG